MPSTKETETLPRNNYFLWLKENRENIKSMYFKDYEVKVIDGKKENIATLITRKASEVWKSLDSSIKQNYSEKLRAMKAEQEPTNNEQPPPPYEEGAPSQKKVKKRKAIPKAVRRAVFTNYITTDDPNKLFGQCFVGCGTVITIDDFEVGHIVPVCKGGNDTIENLRPICRACNQSMGSQNLLDFKEKYGFKDIEDPEYMMQNSIPIDYVHYITNQIMNPVKQVLDLNKEYLELNDSIFEYYKNLSNSKK